MKISREKLGEFFFRLSNFGLVLQGKVIRVPISMDIAEQPVQVELRNGRITRLALPFEQVVGMDLGAKVLFGCVSRRVHVL